MKKHENPLSSTKNFPFNKVLVGRKVYDAAYLLGLFVAFAQFWKLVPAQQVKGRDSEKVLQNLTQSFTFNKVLLLKPEDHSKSYIYSRVLDHYTNLGVPKLHGL